MKKNNVFTKKPLIVAMSALCISSPVSYAQNAEQNNTQSELMEYTVVTGTRREGVAPSETMSPIDTLSGNEVAEQASFDLTDSLSSITPSLNTQRFPIADGTAFIRPVTLRNLSPDQTLVLVNGTRRHRSALVNLQLAPLGTANQGSQGVDFSTIPSAAIERIEVLRDGASAQYGSDAIAGVVNIILKDDSEGTHISAQHGSYFEGDGDRFTLSLNSGLSLPKDGFLNTTLEYSTSDITSRGIARPDAAQIADAIGAENVPFNGLGQRWGDPDIKALKLFVNGELPINDTISAFGNVSYMNNETVSGFFYRTPVSDPSLEVGARGTLQVDADGDFLADNAPQTVVDSILAQNLDPNDYLLPDTDSPSGFVLQNPIYELFPGGYNPAFGADISDSALVFGIKSDNDEGLNWNIRARFAENEVQYTLSDSINPSLGRLSPTSFTPGTLIQEESSINADFIQSFDIGGFASPLNLGFGFELRNETYEIKAGDEASIVAGPTAAIFGVGSDGFQGFPRDSSGSFESDSLAAYVDAEADITDWFTFGAAVRWEEFDEFDSTFDGKLSARFAISDDFALRGTASTGFRAPTPGQVNTLNITTTADSSGNLIPNGTYPVSNPIALALGSQELEPEESQSFTLGAVWTPSNNTTITVDYYTIDIEGRLALQNNAIGDAEATLLTNQGIPDANLLVGSNANFFVNGFDSAVSGIDLNVSSIFSLPVGELTVDWRHSFNEQEVDSVRDETINQSRVFDLENQVPNHRSVLTFKYDTSGMFDGYVRLNRYGGWESSGGLFGPGDGTDMDKYGAAVLVDIEARWTFNDKYTLALGGNNILDEQPDEEKNGVLQFLGAKYSITSPFGFNGGFWYLRGSASF